MFKKMLNNLKKYLKSAEMKKLLWVLTGAFGYAFIPTAIQGFLKKDMTGWKGVLIGGLGTATIGYMADKPWIANGAIASMGLHILYVKGNDMMQSVTGSPIFAFDPNAQMLSDFAPRPDSDILLPDGRRVRVASGPPPSSMNQASPTMNDYTEQPDFRNMLPAAKTKDTLMDFVGNPEVMEFEDFSSKVATGMLN